ncbi:MAG TPA: Ig-like domain-containing protein [Thermoplasmata archaeon]|nr:Ig-like domain-containing protein [Thermoplasmata archaeon]
MSRGARGSTALLVVSIFVGVALAPAASAAGKSETSVAAGLCSDASSPTSSSSAPKDFIRLISKSHSQSARGVAWSPDSSKFAIADDGGTVYVYESSSGNLLKSFAAHTSAVKALSWSRDGSLVATGSRDDTVKLWKTDKWEMAKEIKGVFDGDIEDLAWSPRLPAQGQALELVVASQSGQMKRFNDKGALLTNLSVDNPGIAEGVAIGWDPLGDLITGIVKENFDYTVYTWFATSGNKNKAVRFPQQAFDVKWGGPDLIAVGFNTGNVSLLDRDTLAVKSNVSVGGRAFAVSWMPKGEAGQLNNLAVGVDDGKVRIVDSVQAAVVGSLSGHGTSIQNLEFSPNGTGTKLLSVDQSGVAMTWGAPAPKVVWSSPAKGDRNVTIDVQPMVKFDRAMDDASLKSTVTISAIGAVSVVLSTDSNNTIATIVPATKLESDKDYTLTIGKSAKSHSDVGEVEMGTDEAITFRTKPAAPSGLNIPWLYVGAGVGGLFLIILIIVLIRRKRGGPGPYRERGGEVRVSRRGDKGGDWEK